jgi:hypothetical protein
MLSINGYAAPLAGKTAVDVALHDRAHLASARLDRDLGLEPAGGDLRSETDAAALDAHRFVQQNETGALFRQG